MCKDSELGPRGAVKCHLCLGMTKQEGVCVLYLGKSQSLGLRYNFEELGHSFLGNEDSARERRENCDGCFWLHSELFCLFLREKK